MIRKERRFYRAEVDREAAAAHLDELAASVERGTITLRVGKASARLRTPCVSKVRITGAESPDAGRLTIDILFPQVPRARCETRLLF